MSHNIPFLVLAGLLVIAAVTVAVAWFTNLGARRERLDRSILLLIWTLQQDTGKPVPGYVLVRLIGRHHWATCWRLQQLTGRLIGRGAEVLTPANHELNARLPISAQYWGYTLTRAGFGALTNQTSNSALGGLPNLLPGWTQ